MDSTWMTLSNTGGVGRRPDQSVQEDSERRFDKSLAWHPRAIHGGRIQGHGFAGISTFL